jgi:hypothetical protein
MKVFHYFNLISISSNYFLFTVTAEKKKEGEDKWNRLQFVKECEFLDESFTVDAK